MTEKSETSPAEGAAVDKSNRSAFEQGGVLDDIPPELLQAVIHEVNIQTSMSGPFPPPSVLEEYERVFPGSAERIFQLTEKEQAHRHQSEDKAQKDEIAYRRLGMVLGATSLLLILVAVVITTFMQQPVVAGAVAGVGMVGIITAFIRGRSND